LQVAAISVVIVLFLSFQPQIVKSGDNLFKQLKMFTTVLQLVRANYVEEVDSQILIKGAINGMLDELDPHTAYMDKKHFSSLTERHVGEYSGIGISFAIRDGYLTVISPIEGSPSARLGIRAGDRIVKIEGESAIGIKETEVFEKLRGKPGTTVHVSIQREGEDELLEFDITRAKIAIKSVPYHFFLKPGVGYIRAIRFSASTAKELENALKELEQNGLEKLILDLRGNTGGYLEQAVEVADKFIGGGKRIVFTKGRIADANREFFSTETATHPRFPLIVMISRGTASASEIVSGAIQDWDRGLIVGERSFGKGLVQKPYPLSDGSAVMLTVARYYTPSGRLIQRDYSEGKEKYIEEAFTEQTPDTAVTGKASKTAAGRIVYGGGGIAPDVTISYPHLTKTQQELERRNLFFEFAGKYIAEDKLHYGDFSDFLEGFTPDDSLLDEFCEYATAKDTSLSVEKLDGEKDYIRTGIKRELAGHIWGDRERYRVLINSDPTVWKAAELFPQAALLAKGIIPEQFPEWAAKTEKN